MTLDYQGLTVCKTPPWGQGPVFLQQLALLSGFDLAGMGPGSAEFIHTVVECAKLAFADREAWYGDPRFTDVPLDDLLRRGTRRSAASWSARSARPGLVPGRPAAATPRLPGSRRPRPVAPGLRARRTRLDPGTGEPLSRAGDAAAGVGDTCHLDVADRFGNLVSATPSGGWLQSSPVIPGLGFCLGTRAQMFTLTPGCPARWPPASGRAPRSAPAWRCATASPTWRSARPAATSRTSGRCRSSSTTCSSA